MKDLEQQIEDLERQIVIEKSKSTMKLTREDIKQYYLEALKLEPKMLIDYLIDQIIVYEDKIEIKFNSPLKTSPNKNQGLFLFAFISKLPQYIQNKEKPNMLNIEMRYYI